MAPQIYHPYAEVSHPEGGNQKEKVTRPFLVGILNGFMPCGPLQSVWIVALATGNPVWPARSPCFYLAWVLCRSCWVLGPCFRPWQEFADRVMTIGAVLVVVLGLAMSHKAAL